MRQYLEISSLKQKDVDRFWLKVDKNIKNCWEYLGFKDKDGYGVFSINGKVYRPHRIVYFLTFGKISSKKTLDHLCRNRGCVNPNHLEEVTLKENILRGNAPSSLNSKKNYCPKGHPYDKIDTLGHRRCSICIRDGVRRHRMK